VADLGRSAKMSKTRPSWTRALFTALALAGGIGVFHAFGYRGKYRSAEPPGDVEGAVHLFLFFFLVAMALYTLWRVVMWAFCYAKSTSREKGK